MKVDNGVLLVNRRKDSLRDNFVFPGIDYLDDIEVDGRPVGYVDYGINPLGDRVYIHMLEVDLGTRGKGVGMAVLWSLWNTYQVPIVPLFQYGSSNGFWSSARRRFSAAGAVIEDELRTDEDLFTAKQRWRHLVPESQMNKSIREYWEWVDSERAAGRPVGPGT